MKFLKYPLNRLLNIMNLNLCLIYNNEDDSPVRTANISRKPLKTQMFQGFFILWYNIGTTNGKKVLFIVLIY